MQMEFNASAFLMYNFYVRSSNQKSKKFHIEFDIS